ncbi:hypothetical protein VaNZ11_005012 [Volvox africanus]|uniref:Uncharacterized protein n=1 Tax=Volvox africanus TaxID=51714 RepID=A0ABQ5RZ40_9CHLO|nr:hypothetical protein VaNZ11_005012 [Volvox africanus]
MSGSVCLSLGLCAGAILVFTGRGIRLLLLILMNCLELDSGLCFLLSINFVVKDYFILSLGLSAFIYKLGLFCLMGLRYVSINPYLIRQVIEPGILEVQEGYFERSMCDRMVKLQRSFLRTVAGVKMVTNSLLFRELFQDPLHVFWAKLVFSFGNKLVALKDTIYNSVFREEIRSALGSSCGVESWGCKVIRDLQALGLDLHNIGPSSDVQERVDTLANCRLAVYNIMEELKDQFRAIGLSQVKPREFVSDNRQPGVKCRYQPWMGEPCHPKEYISLMHHMCLICFRLCCWAAEVNRPK